MANINFAKSRELVRKYFDAIKTEADNDFWTVHVLGAYQFMYRYDGDPDLEYEQADKSKGLVLRVAVEPYGVVIFAEAHMDALATSIYRKKEEKAVSGLAAPSVAATMAHEIAHLFGAEHEESGIMSHPDNWVFRSNEFSDATLLRIRTVGHP